MDGTKTGPVADDAARRGRRGSATPRKAQHRDTGDSSGIVPKWRGTIEELDGHVYTYDGRGHATEFAKTTERIGCWAKQHCSAYPLDVWKAIDTLEAPDTDTWRPSTTGVDLADPVELMLFKDDLTTYGKRKVAYGDNTTKVYTVVMAQCSEAIKAKLEARGDWGDINGEHDLVALLKAIKGIMHLQVQDGRYDGLTAFESPKALFNVRQLRHEPTAEYRKRFLAASEVLGHIDVAFGAMFQGIADRILQDDFQTTREAATEEQATEAETQADDAMLAVMFLKQACQVRYHEIGRTMENAYLTDTNNYPADITGAYNMLVNWNATPKPRENDPPLDGVAYTLTEEDVASVICHNCNATGHKWRNCPKAYRKTEHSSTASVMVDDGDSNGDPRWGVTFDDEVTYHEGAVTLCQHGAHPKATTAYDGKARQVLPPGSIGLDSLSTVDLFCDPRMLTNIRQVTQAMRIQCNAGFKTVDHMGHLSGYGDVWFDPDAVANILSLGRVTKRFKVTFDSEHTDGFVLHLPCGRTRRFQSTARGLYTTQFLNVAARKDVPTQEQSKDVTLTIATVEGNMQHFTKREVKQAERARRLQTTLLFPSDQHLKQITEVLQDCPVTAQDVVNAKSIFGPAIGALKGKTTKSRSTPVTVVPIRVPRAIQDRLRRLHLHADICFVNGIGFLVSITEKLKFSTAEAVGNRTDAVLVAGLKRIQGIYRQAGYQVHVVSLDGEFTSARDRIRDEAHMDVNPVAAGEHAPVIERHIRHLKEGVRGMYQMLPFDKKRKLPARLIIELVYAKTFFKNAVPALDGVSEVLSPRELVTQQRINYNRHCALTFGQYVQTHEEHDNTMQSRTICAIALRPTGARQGGYFFLNLQTGRLITRNHWTECVMPQDVIDSVHRLARHSDQVGVEFGDRTGDPLPDSPDDDGDDSTDDDSTDDDDAPDDAVLGAQTPLGLAGVDEHTPGVGDGAGSSAGVGMHTPGVGGGDGNTTDEHQGTQGGGDSPDGDLDRRYGPQTTAYYLRPRKAPTYDVEALLAMGDLEGVTPAAAHLFATNPGATKLGSEQATTFHHLVAKALFLCKRARPDTQLAVGFLCGRVREPDVDDWQKLRRLFAYFRATRDLYLTLEADKVMVAKWWIDASFAVHPDYKSHSGAVFTLGKGTSYAGCRKQNHRFYFNNFAVPFPPNDYDHDPTRTSTEMGKCHLPLLYLAFMHGNHYQHVKQSVYAKIIWTGKFPCIASYKQPAHIQQPSNDLQKECQYHDMGDCHCNCNSWQFC